MLCIYCLDESGSDSEGADSTSSSYSSLSDFVSEMVSSDLSPSKYRKYIHKPIQTVFSLPVYTIHYVFSSPH